MTHREAIKIVIQLADSYRDLCLKKTSADYTQQEIWDRIYRVSDEEDIEYNRALLNVKNAYNLS